MDFAVAIKDLHEEGKGSWVLAVDGDRVLISHGEATGHKPDDRTLHWYPMEDCKAVNFAGPDQPRLVMVVQPKPGIVVAAPGGNRAARRRGENGVP